MACNRLDARELPYLLGTAARHPRCERHLRHSRFTGLREDMGPREMSESPKRHGEEQANMIWLGVKQCRVSFRDADGIEHAVEVEARTLYEAVGLAIDRFCRCEHVKYEPKGLHEFTVEPREPGSQHRLTRNTFDAWLRRPAGSPADMALKTKLKEILGQATKG